jgi:drug/metabolite transporter (DMT)-like permease
VPRVLAGRLLLTGFMVATSVRDALAPELFRRVNFFLFALIAFGTSCAIFLTVATWHAPGQWRILSRQWKDGLGVNVTTATAWLSYFAALNLVEPSIVNAIFFGVAPLCVTLLALLGLRPQSDRTPGTWERLLHGMLLVPLLFLISVVLSGRSSGDPAPLPLAVLGIGLALISGFCITAETVISKRLNQSGISAGTVLGIRFLLVSLIALVAVASNRDHGTDLPLEEILQLSSLAILLVTLPIYFAQVALSWTSPLTTNVTLALSPLFVAAAQWAFSGFRPSAFSISGLIAYGLLAIAAAIVEQRASSRSVSPVTVRRPQTSR